MKILWIVNTIFPEPSLALGLTPPNIGGWMYELAKQISQSDGVELAVATTYAGAKFKYMSIDGIDYFLLPCSNMLKYSKSLETSWKKVCNNYSPDIIHLNGTESPIGLACMRALPHFKYVVSIQGLVSVISRYYYSGISLGEILHNITLRDIVKFDTLFQSKRRFKKRGKFEIECIKRTHHIIGRTSWDYAHTKAINQKVNYHFCNESLRKGFYIASKWSIETCEPYTLFLSQAGSPIKGLNQVLKAVVLLKIEFPNIQIKVGGSNIIDSSSIKTKLKRSGYGKYIARLIKKFSLKDNTTFLGSMNEAQMIVEYQRAHIFICPSSIENSPNSLGEAQLLGIPTVSSYVGGVPDMVEDGKTGLLYRYEEVEMLAENIRKIFKNNELAAKLSRNGIEAAQLRHNSVRNSKSLLAIYKIINE
jgi:glycosyltransferase involved in cell wall biosynthesis